MEAAATFHREASADPGCPRLSLLRTESQLTAFPSNSLRDAVRRNVVGGISAVCMFVCVGVAVCSL